MIAAILAVLILLIPAGITTAYLTSRSTADSATGGVGRWCSVPDPANKPNIYRLSQFDYYASSGSSVIIVPVVRNGQFGAGGGDGRLGVRTWACSTSALTTSSDLKVTAWRNASSSPTINWKQQGSTLAAHRLNPQNGLGAQLLSLHRHGSTPTSAGELARRSSERSQYSWIVSSDRSKTSQTSAPRCALGLNECSLSVEGHPTFASGFNGDTTGSASLNNSVEYLASAYWVRGGEWPTHLERIEEKPVVLNPYDNNIASTDGRQVQWVVMEWWGPTTPPGDLVLEVFVR